MADALASNTLSTAEVIAVGTELLGPTRLDTNSLFIAGMLASLGIELKAKLVVGDEQAALERLFRGSLERCDLVVLTGGLGPTADDVTREAVAAALGLELVEDPQITDRIRERFARRGLTMPEINRRQALVPRGALVLPNPNGTAPGLALTPGRKVVVLLPGPPRELQPMLRELCAPEGLLAARAGTARVHRRSIFTTGRSESHVEELAQPIYSRWARADPPLETTILATPGQIELHLTVRSTDTAAAAQTLEAAGTELVAALGDCVFSRDGRSLPQVVNDLLRERGLTIAAAESCTGGMLLQRLTDVPGSSAAVKGGIVAYSNELKSELLAVDPRLIDEYGAVSEPVAAAMADGLRARTGADVCVAITGIAGPGGGTEAKPVGTVVIAVSICGRALEVRTERFAGGRDMVRLWSTQSALDRVRRSLG
ncbi:MAG TPA: competence/damage-inducible protein A [Vicinamibacterales bacterium]|nr:competence/damage-inducible protein A [Vicinamibacterales bacterium]